MATQLVLTSSSETSTEQPVGQHWVYLPQGPKAMPPPTRQLPPREFPQFPHLPTELRLAVWELALRDGTGERLLLLDPETRALRPHPRSRNHAVFGATTESRQVARRLFPAALEVLTAYYRHEEEEKEEDGEVPRGVERWGSAAVRGGGAVHISFERDTFVLGWHRHLQRRGARGATRLALDLEHQRGTGAATVAATATARRQPFTLPLTPAQCAQITRVMEIEADDLRQWVRGVCDHAACGIGVAARYVRHYFLCGSGMRTGSVGGQRLGDGEEEEGHGCVFRGVRSSWHVWLDDGDDEDEDVREEEDEMSERKEGECEADMDTDMDRLLEDIRQRPGSEVLERWAGSMKHFEGKRLRLKPRELPEDLVFATEGDCKGDGGKTQ